MERLVIYRKETGDEGTFSLATFKGHQWFSGEQPWRDNEKGVSCIKPGLYKAEIYDSPSHGKVYKLEDRDGRTFVEIHIANWMGDETKGFYTELKGCIALGKAIGRMVPPECSYAQRAVESSGVAFSEFMALAGGEPIEIEIIEAFEEGVL